MRQRRLTSHAAAAFVAAALAPHAAQAAHVGGGGYASGTFTCDGTAASMTLVSPFHVFNGDVGNLIVTATSDCDASLTSVDHGNGTADLTGPGVTCTGIGWSWIREGTLVRGDLGGPCTLADGTDEGVLFTLDGTVAAGSFNGTIASPDVVASAPSQGIGPVLGSLTCATGQATITADAPVFVYEGVVGEVHVTGSSPCSGDLVSDVAIAGLSWDMTAPGMTCTGMGGSWSYLGTNLTFWTAGNCTLDGGAIQRMQLFVEAAFATGAGSFAGLGLLNPIP